MLGAKDNETHSYVEVVDAIRQHGAGIDADLEELWRRIVSYILISNKDDHLRNFGFLHAASQGWTLAERTIQTRSWRKPSHTCFRPTSLWTTERHRSTW